MLSQEVTLDVDVIVEQFSKDKKSTETELEAKEEEDAAAKLGISPLPTQNLYAALVGHKTSRFFFSLGLPLDKSFERMT